MTAITLSLARHGLIAECLAEKTAPVAQSERFTVYGIEPQQEGSSAASDQRDLVVVHNFSWNEIDNNVGRAVAEELVPMVLSGSPSFVRGNGIAGEQEVFEHFVGEIVRSMHASERHAWHLFYDNTLAALGQEAVGSGPEAEGSPTRADFIADFAAIYHRTADLAAEVSPESLFDAATCFGFLPLLVGSGVWANGSRNLRPKQVVACDLNPALVSLAQDYANQRDLTGVEFCEADILSAEMPNMLAPRAIAFDVVTAIHLLEHLDPEQTDAAIDVLWSLTKRRLIIAVPVEEVPDTRFGHRQVFRADSLTALGSRICSRAHCFEYHGAFLVLDRDVQTEGTA